MPSAFTGPDQPDDASLRRTLGRAMDAWKQVVALIGMRDGVQADWKFYGAKHGWQWKATRGKRAVLYLIPKEGCFTAGLALKGKSLAALRTSQLPAMLIQEIEDAKEYAEGKPARLEVKSTADVALVKQLIALKLD